MNEPFTHEQELSRAKEAETVLSTPVFKEACNRIDAELRMMREGVHMKDTDMHTRIILAEQMWAKLLDHLKAVMLSGDYAREQLRLRESFTERMKAAIQHGIRL